MMGPACRWFAARPKDVGANRKAVRPRPARLSWDASSLKRRSMRKASPCAMKIRPATSAPSKRLRTSALASAAKPCDAACIMPNRWWCWEMVRHGFGGSPTSIFQTPFKSWIHAREHLANLAKIVYGPAHSEAKPWLATRYQELDAGKVEAILGAVRGLQSRDGTVPKEIEKQIHYFQTNAERMRYAEFRRQGLFVGSGVIEAGCQTIVGLRLKQSGMKWTVRGANAIIALRCLDLSGRWEEFWENCAVGQ